MAQSRKWRGERRWVEGGQRRRRIDGIKEEMRRII